MSTSAFLEFKSYKKSVNGHFILQIGPARCGTNFCLRAILQSPSVHNASKIYTMLHPFDSESYWENMKADLETAKLKAYDKRPCLIHKDSTAFMSEQLKQQLFNIADKILISVRDPIKHSISLAETIMKDEKILTENLSKKFNIYAEEYQHKYIDNYAVNEGFKDWADLVKNVLKKEQGYNHLNELFRSFDFHNTNYPEILAQYQRGVECAWGYPFMMGNKTWDDLPEILSGFDSGKITVIDTTTLQLEAADYMPRLCEQLEIIFIPEMINGWIKKIPWNNVGNQAWIRNVDDTVGILPPSKPTLSPEKLPCILRNTLTKKIHQYVLMASNNKYLCPRFGNVVSDHIEKNPVYYYINAGLHGDDSIKNIVFDKLLERTDLAPYLMGNQKLVQGWQKLYTSSESLLHTRQEALL